MSAFEAEFNCSAGHAYISKTLAASATHTLEGVFTVPASSLAAIVTAGPTLGACLMRCPSDDSGFRTVVGLFPIFDSGTWKWWEEQTFDPIDGPIATDVDTTLRYEMTSAGGTLWDIVFKIDGVTVYTDTGIDLSFGAADPWTFDIGGCWPSGIGGGPSPGEIYFCSSVSADVFSDDFSSGGFTAGGWSVTGDAFVVGSGPTPVSATYHSPEWRFVVGDLQTFEVLSFLDKLSSQKVATLTLNQAAVAEGVVPSDNPEVNIPWPSIDDDPFLTEGSRVLWGLRKEGTPKVWVIRFAGIIMQLEDTAQSDNAYTHYTAFDPWQYLLSRPVCNADGTLPGKDGISYSSTRVDVIAAELLGNTILNQGQVGIDAGAIYGGTGFYAGTIDAPDPIDINFQQGTSVGQAWTQLCNLDVCDIVLLPIYDPKNRPGYLCEFNIASQWGADKDDQIFAWDRPSRSLVGLQRTISGTERANVVQFFAGQGGSAGTATEESDSASIAKFGEYWRQQFFPNQIILAAVQSLAQAQLDLSKNGRTTVVFSPAPERSPIPFTDYYLGDRVRVYASNRFRAPIPSPGLGSSNQQNYERIYGIPIQIADDATETIQQMLTVIPTS